MPGSEDIDLFRSMDLSESERDMIGLLARSHTMSIRDTESYLKLAVKNDPSHPDVEEMRTWLKELSDYLAEDAWMRAKFYDTRMRTRHATIAAYERFVAEHPDSSHADEARARIAALKDGNKEESSK